MVRTVIITNGDKDSLYEEACQSLLWYGVKWLKNKPNSIWSKDKFEEVRENIKKSKLAERLFGAESSIEDLEELWEELMPSVAGKIKDIIKEHLQYIHRYGYYHWINKIAREEPERTFELDLNKIKRGGYGEFNFGTEGPTIT